MQVSNAVLPEALPFLSFPRNSNSVYLKILFIFQFLSFSTYLFVETAMKMLSKVVVTFLLGIVSSLASQGRGNIPDGPQGPSGAILKVNSQKKQWNKDGNIFFNSISSMIC